MKFILTIGLIASATAAGYLSRRFGLFREGLARPIMTVVMVAGYPLVGFLTIWKVRLQPSDAWLPVLGAAQATLQAMIALLIGRRLFRDREERGLFGFACGIGNHGITMAGFVIFLLAGEEGLGYSTVYATYTYVALVLLSYSIARHYSSGAPQRSLGRLLVGSLLNWRSVGLPVCVAAIVVSACGVPRPTVFSEYHVVDVLMYLLVFTAYFSIGLRLHAAHVLKIKRMILGTLAVRHLGGAVLGLGLLSLTLLIGWPLTGLGRTVFLVQSSVPMGVFGVGVANMFYIKPRQASLLFVVTSLVYLVVGLPIVLWLFGG
ncbi:MAG: hypothetical protein QF577_01100 [Phycisphaerae bacterium]|nr:hypothetical protein [Phycisphaerae bacterium]MDP7636121.1 hypothetical protein [Phycisphaerae bacterium]